MVSRSRYLFLSMLTLFLFMTPGVRLPGFPGAAGLTREGVAAAAEHCVRLLAMLALVVVLIRTLGRNRVVIGLVALMHPIANLGLDFRALAVRLALTLEEVAGDKRRSWRDYLEAAAPGEGGHLHLEHIVWRTRDSVLLLVLVLGLMVWGWIV